MNRARHTTPTSLRRPVELQFVRSVTTTHPAEAVFSYASDFSRAHEWREEVVESSAVPAGPMRLGTRLREVAVIAGRRVVTDSVVDGFERDRRFTFDHIAGPLPVSGEMRVEPTGDSTQLTYSLTVRLPGLWALLAPVFRRTGGRTMERSLRTLVERLDSDPS